MNSKKRNAFLISAAAETMETEEIIFGEETAVTETNGYHFDYNNQTYVHYLGVTEDPNGSLRIRGNADFLLGVVLNVV